MLSVQRSKSLWCTCCQLLKLRILHSCSSGSAVEKLSVVTSRTIQDSMSKFPCERLRSRSIQMFREEICSVVLPVHSTDKRSRIHSCITNHRISICLSPLGPLHCRTSLAESESISRRTDTLQ